MATKAKKTAKKSSAKKSPVKSFANTKAKKTASKPPPYVRKLESLLSTVSKSSRSAQWAATILCVLSEDKEDNIVQFVKVLFKYVNQDTIKNGVTRGGSLASLTVDRHHTPPVDAIIVRTGRFTVVRGLIGTRALHKALKLCKGDYQRDFVLGWESMSGSTLKGKAAKYGVKYMHSRSHLLTRMAKAKICFQVETVDRRNCLVFGRRKGKKSVQD